MRHARTSIWIFAIVLLVLALLWLGGYSRLALWAMFLLPVLVVWQVVVILRAKDRPDKTFDDDWYDRK